MAQVSLYVDDATLQKIKISAQKQNLTLSKWVLAVIKKNISPSYPPEFENLFGSISDETFKRPEQMDFSADSKREVF